MATSKIFTTDPELGRIDFVPADDNDKGFQVGFDIQKRVQGLSMALLDNSNTLVNSSNI